MSNIFTKFVKQPDPNILPTGGGFGCTLSHDNNYLVVTHLNSPYITIYLNNRDGTFNKLADPEVLPTGLSRNCAFSPDDNYLVVVFITAPYVIVYQNNRDGTFTKIADPPSLPTNICINCSFSHDGNYLVIAHNNSPVFAIYSINAGVFTRLPNLTSLPADPVGSYDCTFSQDDNYLVTSFSKSPFVNVYLNNKNGTFTLLSNTGFLNGQYATFSPDDNYVAAGYVNSPYFYMYQNNKNGTFTQLPDLSTPLTTVIERCTFSPDGKYVALSNSKEGISIYFNESGKLSKMAKPDILPSGTGRECSFFVENGEEYLIVAHSNYPYISTYKATIPDILEVPTPSHLDHVRDNLSANYIQTANIDLLSYTNWVPIGTDSIPFKGTYNGNDYKILNLTINRPTESYMGLFGFIDGTGVANDVIISNCHIEGNVIASWDAGLLSGDCVGTQVNNCSASGTVKGSGWIGGLIGGSDESQIVGCSSNVTVNSADMTVATDAIGGLIGIALDSTTLISECYSTGIVYGNNNVGGLVGSLSGTSATISKCYSSANVIVLNNSINSACHGGLVGRISEKTKVENCYSKSNVTGNALSSKTGGFIGGYSGGTIGAQIINCYSAGIVTGPSSAGFIFEYTAGGTGISNCYYNSDIAGQTDSFVTGKTTSEMKIQSTYSNWDFTTPIWTMGFYENDGYPQIKTLSTFIEIWTPEDLYNVRNHLDYNYIQMADIDLSVYPDWEPIGIRTYSANDPNIPFKGTYDGRNFKITNMNIISTSTAKTGVGLFGCVVEAEIKNCNVYGSINDPQGYSRSVGMLIGYIPSLSYSRQNPISTKIINCHTHGNILNTMTGWDGTGGLIGYAACEPLIIEECSSSVNIDCPKAQACGGLLGRMEIYESYEVSHIINSYATGNVSCYYYAGGFIGVSETAHFRKCYATGDITNVPYNYEADDYGESAGGFIGYVNYDATFIDCYAAGKATGRRYVGGFVGDSAGGAENYTNCYCYGTVTSVGTTPNYLGGFAGDYSYAEITVTNCYYDNTICVLIDGKATPKTTTEMKTQSTFINWDFTNIPIWTIDGIFNDGYPFLSSNDVLIYTPEQLNNVRNYLNKNYIQMANIDLSTYTNWISIGTDTIPFTGSYDGNEFNITSLKITTHAGINVGLFGKVKTSNYIKNIILENVDICGYQNVGALVGYLNNGLVDNCSSSGIINSYNSYATGGLLGYVENDTDCINKITNCHSSVNININAEILTTWTEGAVKTFDNIGGLIGCIYGYSSFNDKPDEHTVIENCYSTGNITVNLHATLNFRVSSVGGLVGFSNTAIISKCFTNCDITGDRVLGGLIGVTNYSKVINCYSRVNIMLTSSSQSKYQFGGIIGGNYNDTFINCYSACTIPVATIYPDMSHACIDVQTGGSEIVTGCYYDNTLTTLTDLYAVGKSTSEMKIKSTYINWDFNNVWNIDETLSYPHFIKSIYWENFVRFSESLYNESRTSCVVGNILYFGCEEYNQDFDSVGVYLKKLDIMSKTITNLVAIESNPEEIVYRNNKLYIIASGKFYEFDILTNNLTLLFTGTKPISYLTIFNDKIYVISATSANNAGLFEWDENNNWIIKTELSSTRKITELINFNNNLFVVEEGSSNPNRGSLLKYDIATSLFNSVAPPLNPYIYVCGTVVLNNELYATTYLNSPTPYVGGALLKWNGVDSWIVIISNNTEGKTFLNSDLFTDGQNIYAQTFFATTEMPHEQSLVKANFKTNQWDTLVYEKDGTLNSGGVGMACISPDLILGLHNNDCIKYYGKLIVNISINKRKRRIVMFV